MEKKNNDYSKYSKEELIKKIESVENILIKSLKNCGLRSRLIESAHETEYHIDYPYIAGYLESTLYAALNIIYKD